MRTTGRAAAFAVAGLLLARAAFAQPAPSTAAVAEDLFQEGRRLMQENHAAEACPKFAEAQRLDPGSGTLLNLAHCYEVVGRTASAWAEYRKMPSLAQRDGRPDRATLAEERVAVLEPHLSHLVVVVARAAEGFSLAVDGDPLGDAAWGTAVPVDPGTHVVTAEAPGKRSWRGEVLVRANGDTETVRVPALEDMPAPPLPARRAEAPAPRAAARGGRDWAYVVGGAGLLGVALGAAFGMRAITKRRDSNAVVARDGYSSPEAVDLNDQAKTAAWISDVAVGVGLVGIGVGTYLLVSANHGPTVAVGGAF
jgi:hypothetical protein